MRKPAFCKWENKEADQLRGNHEAKTKTQISFAVIAKLISDFFFATRIEQSLYFLNTKFNPLAIFCDCTARFVSALVGNPEDRFSHNEAQIFLFKFQSCVQCSEDYCAGCFAAFHLKGNLKKHRSMPITVSETYSLP